MYTDVAVNKEMHLGETQGSHPLDPPTSLWMIRPARCVLTQWHQGHNNWTDFASLQTCAAQRIGQNGSQAERRRFGSEWDNAQVSGRLAGTGGNALTALTLEVGEPVHVTLRGLGELAGFAAENIGPGEQGWVLSKASLTSDDGSFQRYADELSRIFLTASGVPVDQVFQFLAVVHADRTADIFVNDFPVVVEMKSTRDIQKGERVLLSDIADVRRVRFPEVALTPTDKIVYLFKVGWRFGLYFDLSPRVPPAEAPAGPATPLDVDGAERALGALYRRLAYYDVYGAVEATEHFAELVSDGWFPFIEMLSGDFAELSRAYGDKFNLEERVGTVVTRYSPERIQRITARWWSNASFAEHRQIIEAGTAAYLQGTEAGFINCIKTLSTETEGLLRAIVRADTGTGQVVVGKFLEHITEKARLEAGEGYSLLFVQPFLNYLKQQVFQNFNVDSGDVGMSRNTSSHGVASASAYTKARALQYILILDQIYFYDHRVADKSG